MSDSRVNCCVVGRCYDVLLSVIVCSDTVAMELCKAASSVLRVLVLIYKVSVIV